MDWMCDIIIVRWLTKGCNMILKSFAYKEHGGQPNEWSIDKFEVNELFNLLIGINATGKSRTITKIRYLAELISGARPIFSVGFDDPSGTYMTELYDKDDTYQYTLEIDNGVICNEELRINDEQHPKIKRGAGGISEIFTTEVQRNVKFQLPQNQLVVLSRRDALQHPYLEKLFTWANGERMYSFGSRFGQDTFLAKANSDNISVNPHDMNASVALYAKGTREYPKSFENSVIQAMSQIGYNLEKIEIGPISSVAAALVQPITNGAPLYSFYIAEKGNTAVIKQYDISQGMFRALALIIQLTYNKFSHSSSTILIDDIGEGLDFNRSSSLIKLVLELARESNTQIIMSTNDRYVMNGVDLEYWQIIDRVAGKCKIYNIRNEPKKFEDFQYLGLNNFDFLRTNFIHSDWTPE
jgi:energy-coupling factor transporter ATP-binding protein EcfA2